MGYMGPLVEKLLTLPRDIGGEPGTLCARVGGQYYYPFIPPGMEAWFQTTIEGIPAQRGYTAYCVLFFHLTFGYVVPDVFQLAFVTGGTRAYQGILTGHLIEDGIDYLFMLTPDKSMTAYITNISPMNQYFEMVSHYLIFSTEKDYGIFKKYLEKLNFPNGVPELV